MSLKNYSVDEEDNKREETMNSEYIGSSVWVRGEIIEVAAEFPGGVLVNVGTSDSKGVADETEILMAIDSDDIKVTDEDDRLIDG